MSKTIDARGYSCPQPIIMTRNGLKEAKEGEVTIIVDTMTQVQNCIRAAEMLGWEVTWEERDDDYYLVARR
jgi:tRNA 2-thiouridine synthesizing protein A